jgi:hypothetical protein
MSLRAVKQIIEPKPCIESVGATCSTWSRTDSRAALLPMIRSNVRSA